MKADHKKDVILWMKPYSAIIHASNLSQTASNTCSWNQSGLFNIVTF